MNMIRKSILYIDPGYKDELKNTAIDVCSDPVVKLKLRKKFKMLSTNFLCALSFFFLDLFEI